MITVTAPAQELPGPASSNITAGADPHRIDLGRSNELTVRLPLSFDVDPAHEAHEPPEARGLRRDGVRLMVSRGDEQPESTTFDMLAQLLSPGDMLVVNTSATVPAAIDGELPGGRRIVLHVSTELPGGLWMVEPRRADPRRIDRTAPPPGCACDDRIGRRHDDRPGAARAVLEAPVAGDSGRRPARRTRRQWSPDPLPVRHSGLADRRLPDGVRQRAGQRRDAECLAPVHDRPGDAPRSARYLGGADHAAHGRVVARGPRAAVPGALSSSVVDGGAGERWCTPPVVG